MKRIMCLFLILTTGIYAAVWAQEAYGVSRAKADGTAVPHEETGRTGGLSREGLEAMMDAPIRGGTGGAVIGDNVAYISTGRIYSVDAEGEGELYPCETMPNQEAEVSGELLIEENPLDGYSKYARFHSALREAWMWLDEIVWDSRYDVLEWVRNEYRDIPREADVLIGMGCRTVTEKDVITEAFAGELGLDGTAAGTDAAAFDTRHTLNTGFYHALSYTFVWAPEAGENTAETYRRIGTVDIYYDIQYRAYPVIRMPMMAG